MPKPLTETYLAGMATIRATRAGTKETSLYTPLANLLNAVGDELSP